MIDSLTRTSAKKVLLRVEAWRLLVARPMLFLPGVMVTICTSTAMYGLMKFHLTGGWFGPIFVAALLLFAWLAWCVYLCAMSFTAWQHDELALGDGVKELARRPAAVAETFAWLFGIGALACVLAPITLTFSLLAAIFFGIHAPLVTLAGEQSGWAAIVESTRHARRHLKTTLLVAAALTCCATVNGFAVFLGSGDLLSIFLQPSGMTLIILLLTFCEQALTCYAIIFATGCYLRDLYSPRYTRPQ